MKKLRNSKNGRSKERSEKFDLVKKLVKSNTNIVKQFLKSNKLVKSFHM